MYYLNSYIFSEFLKYWCNVRFSIRYSAMLMQYNWFNADDFLFNLVTLFVIYKKCLPVAWQKHSVIRVQNVKTPCDSLGLIMWHKLISLQLLLFTLFAWQQQCNAECCRPTSVSFDPINITSTKCSDYPGGKKAAFWTLAECETNLCGNLLSPSPCCGVGNCNVFCCNCNLGCLGEVGKSVLTEFKDKYSLTLKNIK